VGTRTCQTEGASLDDERRAEEALQRVDRELSEAESRSDRLQRSLEATLAQLEGNVVRPVDIEQLGELLGSVSRLCHKINNPLTSIMGRAQMLQLKVKQGQDEQLAKSIAVIEESAKRVAALVQELANLVCHARKEFVESYDSNNNSR
jgi:signal transduction histidine kinase